MSNHFHLLLEVDRFPTALIPQSLRKGRLANVVEARDRFIRGAVLDQGHLASEVADFLACHPSNVSRALQKI
jgi:hypothetical protein